MKQKSILITIMVILITGLIAAGQSARTVSGIVTGFKNVPLNNVKVINQNTGKETLTDRNGQFVIGCNSKDQLVFRANGFKVKKLKTGEENIYQVDLVYVINPKSFSEATENEHISADALQKAIDDQANKNVRDYSKYSSIWILIQSEIYDVRVAGNAVYNKKVKSMNSNPQVLYVVNGKIVTDISYINPAYVKSIEFTDDASNTMYGVSGANGVLKITLK